MRILHTMIRVGDLDRSIAFYTEILGMQLLRRQDYPDGRFTLAFVGYGPESEGAVLELTHNWDTTSYDLGNGYGHVALAVPDAAVADGHRRIPWGALFRSRSLWRVMAMYGTYGWGGYFYLSWLHTYLVKGRGLPAAAEAAA